MIKILLILLFSQAGISCYGQKIRFSDTTNVWFIRNLFDINTSAGIQISSKNSSCSYSGSLMSAGISYNVLNAIYDSGLIREDTVAKTVFIRYYNPALHAYNAFDEVLYDYNLVPSDTIRHQQAQYPKTVSWVTLVDSTQINTIWYKVWHFNGYCDCITYLLNYSYNVIEGIGCTNGVVYPVNPEAPFTTSQQLICFSNNGNSYLLSNTVSSHGRLGTINFDNSTSCGLLATSQVFDRNNKIDIFPNPVSNSITIKSPYEITAVTIDNMTGQTVFTSYYHGEEVQVDVANLPSGMYLIRINGTEVRKFVKQ
jgi:type IX secretion system substrate protein